ncbi:MAG: hypothetical protein WC365_09810 [Candidatus Babeliales bacterium]|jgi:hypothetical protein
MDGRIAELLRKILLKQQLIFLTQAEIKELEKQIQIERERNENG